MGMTRRLVLTFALALGACTAGAGVTHTVQDPSVTHTATANESSLEHASDSATGSAAARMEHRERGDEE